MLPIAFWAISRSFHTRNAPGIAGPVLRRSVVVVVGESSECGHGFPSHIEVGVARTVFEYLDYAITSHIQVQVRVAAMRQMVGDEGVHEGVDTAFGGEDLQQLAQVGGGNVSNIIRRDDIVSVFPSGIACKATSRKRTQPTRFVML